MMSTPSWLRRRLARQSPGSTVAGAGGGQLFIGGLGLHALQGGAHPGFVALPPGELRRGAGGGCN